MEKIKNEYVRQLIGLIIIAVMAVLTCVSVTMSGGIATVNASTDDVIVPGFTLTFSDTNTWYNSDSDDYSYSIYDLDEYPYKAYSFSDADDVIYGCSLYENDVLLGSTDVFDPYVIIVDENIGYTATNASHVVFEIDPNDLSSNSGTLALYVGPRTLYLDYVKSDEYAVSTADMPSDPSVEGYTFDGWYYDSNYTDEYDGEQITVNTDLYAKMTPITYTIDYNGSSTNGTYNIESSTITLPTAVKTGYTFVGWYDNSTFTGTAITSIASGSTGDKEYYAKFTAITYDITYILNDGSGVSDSTYTIESDDITLPTPSKSGYTFVGWYDNADFNGSAVTTLESGSTGDKTYYAKYGVQTFTVNFYVQGELYYTMTVDYGTILNTYVYVSQTNEIVTFSSQMSALMSSGVESDLDIDADEEFGVYVRLTYICGDFEVTDLVEYESTLSGLRVPDSDETFIGWFYDEDYNESVSSDDVIKADTVLYGQTQESQVMDIVMSIVTSLYFIIAMCVLGAVLVIVIVKKVKSRG